MNFSRIISALAVLVMLPFYVLTGGIDLIGSGERPEDAKTNIVGIGAYFRSQGITTDGESYYFSSKTTLIRTELDGRTLIKGNFSAIPDELSALGIKHIGGMSFYNGKIYAGMEDSKVWDHPIIGVFDAETLELTEYYDMDAELITRGMPWVCVDPDTGYLYCADHSKKPTMLIAYDINNSMAEVERIPLADIIPSIQGCEFKDGFMFAATNDETQAIYKVNVHTGEFEKYLDRNLTGGEGEGMTFITKDGKTVLVGMDMGTIFINSFLREYEYK